MRGGCALVQCTLVEGVSHTRSMGLEGGGGRATTNVQDQWPLSPVRSRSLLPFSANCG
jgi:hypothetical protein